MEIKSIKEFDKFLTEAENEIIIFKYSPICPISKRIEDQFDDWYLKLEKKINLFKVNVIAARTVSNHIADKFDITHESPQLIWLDKEKKIKTYNSHYAIDEAYLNNNI